MVNVSFIGYDIDMLFEYNDREGATENVWCQGKLISIVNENTNAVDIKWKEEGHSDTNQRTLREKLLKMKYNTQKQVKGAWRQELYMVLSTDL